MYWLIEGVAPAAFEPAGKNAEADIASGFPVGVTVLRVRKADTSEAGEAGETVSSTVTPPTAIVRDKDLV